MTSIMKKHLTWVLEGLCLGISEEKRSKLASPPSPRAWGPEGILGFTNCFAQKTPSRTQTLKPPSHDGLWGHACMSRIRGDYLPGSTPVTGNSSPPPCFLFSTHCCCFSSSLSHSLWLTLGLPGPAPDLLTLKDPIWTFPQFSTWLLSFHFQIACLAPQLHSLDGDTPRSWRGSYRLASSHFPARRTSDYIVVLNRRGRIQGLLLGVNSMPQLRVKSSFPLPDPNKGQGRSLAREKNCRRKVSAQTFPPDSLWP